ncbi:MAG: prepilin-type N-terminal cleavage/methylation domain-containing protein [Planctomycetota bacterium]
MRQNPPTRARRAGFTLIEILAVIGIIALLITILIPVVGTARRSATRATDSAQLRGIVQAFGSFAAGEDGRYPLPSRLDVSDQTIEGATESFQKDTTGSIFSLLLYNDFLRPDSLISPAETNAAVRDDNDYSQGAPPTLPGARARFALWDPDFRGTPGDHVLASGTPGSAAPEGIANVSYAHAAPFGSRLRSWGTQGSSSTALISNRGPEYLDTAAVINNNETTITFAQAPNYQDSNTLEFFTPDRLWSGHIAYNDASVEFGNTPESRKRTGSNDGEGNSFSADNAFANENTFGGEVAARRNQIGQGVNNYLRGYTNVQVGGATDDREDALADVWDLTTAEASNYMTGD